MQPKLDDKSVEILNRLRNKLKSSNYDALAAAVKQVGIEAVEQMIFNLSNNTVEWSGGIFRVQVITGRLRAGVRLAWPFMGNQYTAYVYNNTAYAESVRAGETGADKKRRLLYGGKPAQQNKQGRLYKRIPSKVPGDITRFWTLTEDSMLDDQYPCPFPEATAEDIQTRATELIGNAFVEIMTP